MLNERCAALLRLLGGDGHTMQIAALAARLSLTSRSVRYNLDKLDAFLADSGAPKLRRTPGVGISCTLAPEQFQLLRKKLEESTPRQYAASQTERLDILLAALLCAKDYITMDTLAAKLDVSRTTIVTDLRALRERLPQSGLTLLSQTNRGLRLTGDEKYLRRAAIELFRRNADAESEALHEIAPPLQRAHKLPLAEFDSLFRDVDVRFIEACVAEAEQQLAITFSDEAFCALTLHIIIAIQRLRHGSEILMEPNELKRCRTTPEFTAASCVAAKLEKIFHLKIPFDEIGYIAIHLLGSNLQTAATAQWHDNSAMQILTGRLLRLTAQKLAQPEIARDAHLFNGLLAHLRPALYRLKNDLHLVNPILTEIKADYAALFDAVKDGLHPAEKLSGKRFDDAEIGYFTLHFGAALERRKDGARKAPNVLVVCSTGAGTAQLLSSKLRQFFRVRIAATAPWRQAARILAEQPIDLMVTTLPVQACGVPCIQVSPLLPKKDIVRLRAYLPEYERPSDALLERALAAVERTCEIKDRDALTAALSELLHAEPMAPRKGEEQPLLRDLLTKETIALRVDARDWEEAVRIGGALMLENDMIEARYIDAMVTTVKELGAYIVIAPGIAMPHARPEDGAKKVGGALVTLRQPVNFGNPENDPVNVLVLLCAVDKVAHLNALADLMQLLEDEAFPEVAARAQSKEELLHYIFETTKGETEDA